MVNEILITDHISYACAKPYSILFVSNREAQD
jgi:hypothetical protein